MRVAVTGACGQLGWELCRQLGPLAIPLTRRELDLTDKASIASVISLLLPDVLINCAAYTQVDRAEDEPTLCRCVNSDAVRHLSDCCHDVSCRLIQVSTDFVFGGQGRLGGYREEDAVIPAVRTPKPSK